MSQERSAEWLRGAVESHINTCNLITSITSATASHPARQGLMAAGKELHNQLDRYRALLAEAEAREALQGSKEKMALSRIYELASRQLAEPAGAGDAVAMAKICTEVEAVHLPRDVSVPTAAEVIASAEKALEGALALDPNCDHAYTHRGGAIWTICDECGKQWADDKGGFKPDKPNKHILKIEEALALIAKWKEAQRLLEGQ